MTKRSWLDITEYIAITASVGGMIITAIAKQVMFTTAPLTLALLLNIINRKRYFDQLKIDLNHDSQVIESLNHKYESLTQLVNHLQDNFSYSQQQLGLIPQQLQELAETKLSQSDISQVIENLNHKYESLTQLVNHLQDNFSNTKETLTPSNQNDIKLPINNLAPQLTLIEEKLKQLQRIHESRINYMYEIVTPMVQKIASLEDQVNAEFKRVLTIEFRSQLIELITPIIQEIIISLRQDFEGFKLEMKDFINKFKTLSQTLEEDFPQKFRTLEDSLEDLSDASYSADKTIQDLDKFTENIDQILKRGFGTK